MKLHPWKAVPESQRCQLWSREFGQRTEVQSVDSPSSQIEHNQDSSEADPLSIEKVSCRQHCDVDKSPAEETEETEEAGGKGYVVLLMNVVESAGKRNLGNAGWAAFTARRCRVGVV